MFHGNEAVKVLKLNFYYPIIHETKKSFRFSMLIWKYNDKGYQGVVVNLRIVCFEKYDFLRQKCIIGFTNAVKENLPSKCKTSDLPGTETNINCLMSVVDKVMLLVSNEPS